MGCSATHEPSGAPPPVVTRPPSSTAIQGQPIWVLERSNLYAAGPDCRGAADFVLYDDGHVVYCDVVGSASGGSSYRVAQLDPDAQRGFLASLPAAELSALGPAPVVHDDPQGPVTRIDLQAKGAWHHVTFRGAFRTTPASAWERFHDAVAGAFGGTSPPPAAFVTTYRKLARFSATTSQPFIPQTIRVTLRPLVAAAPAKRPAGAGPTPWPVEWPTLKSAGAKASPLGGGTLVLDGALRGPLEELGRRGPVRINGKVYALSWEYALPGERTWR